MAYILPAESKFTSVNKYPKMIKLIKPSISQ